MHEEQTVPELIAAAAEGDSKAWAALVRRFDTPGQPYLSQPDPGQAPRFTDYAHLARVLEWSAGDDDDRGG